MNTFEKTFFKKYIPEWQEITEVFHKHWIKVINDIILALLLWVFIPVFLFYNSALLQEKISFIYFQIYLVLVYIIIIYKILNWYNDALILSKSSITKLKWSLLKSSTTNIDYEHVDGVWVEKNGISDTIFWKWDLIIYKDWWEEIVLSDADNPYKIVDKIEDITSQIDINEEENKFDLMMDTLWWMVQNYLWEDKSSFNSLEKKEAQNELSKKLQEDFLEKIENKNGTIDLR